MKHFKYLKYLLKHKWYVFKEACRLGIPWRGLVHDLSKLRPREWFPYAEYFYGDRSCITISVTSTSIKDDRKEAFDLAWLQHQHSNPHHWQYWILREDSGETKILEMPDAYRKEMLADWIGAGKAILGNTADTKGWYLRNKDKILLGEETRGWIEAMLGIPYKK